MVIDFADKETARLASGIRSRQYAIRINKQWRIAFTPDDDGSMSDVEVTDYH